MNATALNSRKCVNKNLSRKLPPSRRRQATATHKEAKSSPSRCPDTTNRVYNSPVRALRTMYVRLSLPARKLDQVGSSRTRLLSGSSTARLRVKIPGARATNAPNRTNFCRFCTYVHLCAVGCTCVHQNEKFQKWCTNRTQVHIPGHLHLLAVKKFIRTSATCPDRSLTILRGEGGLPRPPFRRGWNRALPKLKPQWRRL
jgi:hypothetical protein